jgi:CMP/dCMP kinase
MLWGEPYAAHTMNTEATLNKSGSFILSQVGYGQENEIIHPLPFGPGITISQQAGSGAHTIAELTSALLQKSERPGSPPWRVFDRQLVEKALEEHDLPKRFARHMREDRRTYLEDVTDELCGLRPPSWILVPQVAETIKHLLKGGHVIVVGRGATVITSRMPGIFHVRLVASLEKRIARVQNYHNLTLPEATRYVEGEDRGSRRYVKAHFNARIENELLYHLVINTDRVSYEDTSKLIAAGALQCFAKAE